MLAGGNMGFTGGLAGARNAAIICLASSDSTGNPKSMVEEIREAQCRCNLKLDQTILAAGKRNRKQLVPPPSLRSGAVACRETFV